MKRCLACLRPNEDQVIHCAFCRNRLFSELTPGHPPRPPALPIVRCSRSLAFVAYGAMAACAVFSSGSIIFHASRLNRLQSSFEEETRGLEQRHVEQLQLANQSRSVKLATAEADFQALLNNPRFSSGQLAADHHTEEWTRRLAHDPAMAKTRLETVLLEMEALGHDANIAAQNALERVATMAAPRGSRVEVSATANGFVVKVAFRMSALSSREEGAVTKHHTTEAMRNEIVGLCSRVTRDLFDYCGSRGIQKISVSCNHAIQRSAIPLNATDTERTELLARAPVVMDKLYRASLDRQAAQAITNWRRISLPSLQRLMNTEFDGLNNLTINSGTLVTGREKDPNGPLEF